MSCCLSDSRWAAASLTAEHGALCCGERCHGSQTQLTRSWKLPTGSWEDSETHLNIFSEIYRRSWFILYILLLYILYMYYCYIYYWYIYIYIYIYIQILYTLLYIYTTVIYTVYILLLYIYKYCIHYCIYIQLYIYTVHILLLYIYSTVYTVYILLLYILYIYYCYICIHYCIYIGKERKGEENRGGNRRRGEEGRGGEMSVWCLRWQSDVWDYPGVQLSTCVDLNKHGSCLSWVLQG